MILFYFFQTLCYLEIHNKVYSQLITFQASCFGFHNPLLHITSITITRIKKTFGSDIQFLITQYPCFATSVRILVGRVWVHVRIKCLCVVTSLLMAEPEMVVTFHLKFQYELWRQVFETKKQDILSLLLCRVSSVQTSSWACCNHSTHSRRIIAHLSEPNHNNDRIKWLRKSGVSIALISVAKPKKKRTFKIITEYDSGVPASTSRVCGQKIHQQRCWYSYQHFG